ncbi:MAG: bile acid:sodium symporter family protein [Bacteroidia bacterium]
MRLSPRIAVLLSVGLVLGVLALVLDRAWLGPLLTLAFLSLALAAQGSPLTRGYTYTLIIFAAVALSLSYPALFTTWGDFSLKKLIVPLLQIIMFGMGTALSWRDFEGVVKMPRGVLVGIVCQFTIMPFVGYALAASFGFPPEIAAGIILVGASPSGLASNVMSYLAKANLALSVTLTAVATLMAPIMTPFLMKLLAAAYVEISFWKMMWDIVKMVIIPIILGLLFNHFLHGKFPWLDKIMPLVSMAGIAFIICIITAAGRDSLLDVGLLLLLACLIHNLAGYGLGYAICRLLRMPEQDCRTIALEVGMQNGGLASGIALGMDKVATVGLAPAVFGPLMNITGSSLAMWWRTMSERAAARAGGPA